MTDGRKRGMKLLDVEADVQMSGLTWPMSGLLATVAQQYEKINVRVRRTNIFNESADCFL